MTPNPPPNTGPDEWAAQLRAERIALEIRDLNAMSVVPEALRAAGEAYLRVLEEFWRG